jgi:signal transduction histidine kinase
MATFPLTMDKHIIFCIIGFVFFMLQFFRQGYKYQILSAFAIASTLLLYVNNSPAWRYAIGIIELILIIAIFIVMSVEKKKEELKAKAEAEAAKAAAASEEASGE